ncbi:hypothetical protein Salat_0205000 [Sesamum alatum]|uniref:Reverse transcriptase zinc-binding domain-containing protein n=1 Tax=Sesamum alatum TaxID=300844 RepID=A0AAE1YXS2_9LAMI|nr:hypothetical protein Salat_0205000 [Sesamum alatum]
MAIPNSLVWHFSKTESFSVRSAYNVSVELAHKDIRACSRGLGEVPRGGWDFIWKQKLSGKVKVFAWRLCKQALPTGLNLKRRHLQLQCSCSHCFVEEEDSKHSMLDYDFARQTWALSNLPWNVVSVWGDCAESWVHYLHRNLEAWEYRFALMVAWRLCYCRNKCLMEESRSSPGEVVTTCTSYLLSFDAAFPANNSVED